MFLAYICAAKRESAGEQDDAENGAFFLAIYESLIYISAKLSHSVGYHKL